MIADTADTHMTDLVWFRTNKGANYRVRAPRPGEVDELARMMLPAGTVWDGGFQNPSPSTPWRVLAIRLPLRRVARVLTIAERDPTGVFHVMPVALGERLALS